MAGINLVRRLKDKKSGAGGDGGDKKKLFGFSMSSFGSAASESVNVSSGDKVKLVLFFIGVGSIFFMKNWVKDYTGQLEAAKRQEIAAVDQLIAGERRKLDALKSLAAEAEAFDKQMTELQRKLQIIESLGRNRNLAVRMVDFIVSEMPANIWLSKMNLDTKSDQKVELSGNATTMQVVSEFMKRLEGAVFFPSWHLVETQKEENAAAVPGKGQTPADTRSFQLNAKVVPL